MPPVRRKPATQLALELTENIPVGTYVLRTKRGAVPRFTFLSKRFLKMLDLHREAAMEDFKSVLAAVHPEDREHFGRLNDEAIAGKHPFFWEGRAMVRGEIRWMSVESNPREGEGGRTIWEGVLMDITDRKMAAESLRQSHERIQLAAESAGIGFWEYDIATDRQHWDDQTLKIYGICREEFGGRGIDWHEFLHPDDREKQDKLVWQVWKEGRQYNQEFRIIRRDGEIRHIRGTALITRDAQGAAIRMTGINYDVTDQKRIEASLVESRQREKQREKEYRHKLEHKLKTSLAASAIAHEIKLPLSAILLQSQMARQTGKVSQRALKSITHEASQVVSTIEKMSVLLRNVETQQKPVNLPDVVKSAVHQVRGLLTKNHIKLERSAMAPYHRILGDDVQLQHVITNLLRNSIEAIVMQGGKQRVISIAMTEQKRSVSLVIGDSGPGWTGAERDKTPLRTTKPGGSGIGLFIVRTAMKNHRGRIYFRKSPLGGAEVRLSFSRREGALP